MSLDTNCSGDLNYCFSYNIQIWLAPLGTTFQTRFCVSGALLTTQTTLGRLVRDGSVKAKISAPVFDFQQYVSRDFVGGPTNYRGDLRVS